MYAVVDSTAEGVTSPYFGKVVSVHRTIETAKRNLLKQTIELKNKKGYLIAVSAFSLVSSERRLRKGQRAPYKHIKLLKDESEKVFRKLKTRGPQVDAKAPAGKARAEKKRRRGRPPKTEGEKLTAYIGFALTPKERRSMKKAAETLDMNLSQYLRHLHAKHVRT